MCRIADRLREHPVIVAHSENNFNGSGVRRLLSNKFELDKVNLFIFPFSCLVYFFFTL